MIIPFPFLFRKMPLSFPFFALHFLFLRKRTESFRFVFNPNHAVTIVLDTGVAVDDPEHHHQGDTKARSTEEPEDPSPQIRHTITKTMKRRWGHHALPMGFTPRQYPKVSNYLMINKNMMDPTSHSHGSRIICKQ
jgi:hypothetical protein